MRTGAPHNPYSSAHLGPDGTEYIFPDDCSRQEMLARVHAAGWNVFLVGPHGAGKSTLARALLAEASAHNIATVTFRWSEETPRLGRKWHGGLSFARRIPGAESRPRALLFLDGGERMSPAALAQIRRVCARRGFALMATLHDEPPPEWLAPADSRTAFARLFARWRRMPTAERPAPCVLRMKPRADALLQIMQRREPNRSVTMQECADRLARQGGNMRSALFELYDEFESEDSARSVVTDSQAVE